MNTNNKTPKPLLFKKPTLLSNKPTKSPIKTMSLDEKEKLIKDKLIATVTRFRTSTRNSFNKKEQIEKVTQDMKYPSIKVKQTNLDVHESIYKKNEFKNSLRQWIRSSRKYF
jgi:hypothetical protein